VTPLQPNLTAEDYEQVFAALAHGTRRHVLLLLSRLGGELPSGYLAKRFQHSWPTTTRHLKVLEEAGLVEVQRKGRSGLYRLNRERLNRIVGSWLAQLDAPTPDQRYPRLNPPPKPKGE
jgi:DNA-binding transcriptional ArsR family regulator